MFRFSHASTVTTIQRRPLGYEPAVSPYTDAAGENPMHAVLAYLAGQR